MRLRLRDDQGVGIIVVLGISTFVMILIVTAVAMANNALSMSQHRTSYERSLAAAETGVDQTLGRLQRAYDEFSADYPVPALASAQFASPACNSTPITAPADFDTADAERDWAQRTLEDLADAHPDCIVSVRVPNADGGQDTIGQYVILKPSTPLVSGRYPGSSDFRGC